MNPLPQEPTIKFIPRDLSWLNFNERVLEEATDTHNPLLERCKFLAIFASNMDEFFMVRVAALKRLLDSGYNRTDAFGFYPQDIYAQVREKAAALNKKLYEVYQGKIQKELDKNGVNFKKYNELTAEQKKAANRYFELSAFPIITPMAIDQGHPFPVLASRTIAFAVALTRYEKPYLAIIPIPKVLPRLLRLPSDKEEFSFILIEELIRSHLENFFKGYKVAGDLLFRVIRDSELVIDEEYAPDLLKAIENEVKKRPRAKVVYLESEKNASPELLEPLCAGLDFPKEDISYAESNLDLTYLFELLPEVTKPQLCFTGYVPAKPVYENIFDKISESDLMIHLPYQSFQPTIDLATQAARDPNVLGIKITLYRVNEDSAIIKALKDAAKNKKQVTVLVEIKARFDEEKNINWAKELEEAGCHVIYGMPGMKIHSKAMLVVRKEEGRIKRYVHLSTGNYNEKTAGVYTDIGYFTANEDFARDISEVFNVITGYSLPTRWKRIVASPNDLREYFFELVDQEIDYQKKYKNGAIFAKMNSLEDPRMIEKLYAASYAGVKVHLIVRGICCLIPQVKGLSENIRVKSIVGRFLEHSRIYIFNNNADQRVFLSSADWMSRNLDRRIELLFEIHKEEHKQHLLSVMDTYWKDTLKARELLSDASYVRKKEDPAFNAQEFLIQQYSS